jgi:hypothetical protein
VLVLFLVDAVEDELAFTGGGDDIVSDAFTLGDGGCCFVSGLATGMLLLAAESVDGNGGGGELGQRELDEDGLPDAAVTDVEVLVAPLGTGEEGSVVVCRAATGAE